MRRPTSPVRPVGHVNDWPYEDYAAFVALIESAGKYMLLGEHEITAVLDAAIDIGLEGGERHWLANEVLAGVFGVFYMRSGDCYLEAGPFLEHGWPSDLSDPGTVAWARELAAAGPGG